MIVGTDQFVYFDAGDPKRCLAPDVMIWERDVSSPAGHLCDALGLY